MDSSFFEDSLSQFDLELGLAEAETLTDAGDTPFSFFLSDSSGGVFYSVVE
jgi:hypothetical protein